MVEASDELRKRLELQDHGHELAGLDTGRMARFGVGNARTEQIKEDKRKKRAYRDALDRLLTTDPEYHRLYEELGNKLGEAESDADQTIAALQTALQAQQEANLEMRSRAPKIDGKAVFRYADGRVVDEDGDEIDAVIAASIIWPADAPSAEDYFAGIERENELRGSLEEWQNYRNDALGDIRNRYEDRDNPMSKDDLRDAMTKIAEDAPSNPLAASSELAATTPVVSSAVAVPSLSD